ncbi:zinc finger and BTB domain-containing protein 14-like [Trichoplusia ni]|uniref:Zinc finger and BTB domain-containing protein 14-like n=1 Tax=Trichoplusia ni TaxID=7111 RepID=A0A7E5WL78_TRINI|nr:zinc finger and BTB domain-containing protein 14-like [Trichoplusia ni]XP_026741506.1 zinc finger and BTB domain-containing protein 14-like [Trichoplusia ni]
MSQQYSLRWNNHQPNFISMFTSLLNTQTLVDVTLSAEGKQLLAHKVVLSACSTYFQSLFVDNPSPHPIVILKDVTYADLRTMVDFMYCGVVNVTEEQLPKVLDTAKLLKIKGLTEMPDSTSLTRAQSERNGTEQADSLDSQRESPAESSVNKKKRRRKSSSGSNAVMESETRTEASQTVEPITFSSVPQRRYNEIRTIDNSQQTQETPETADQSDVMVDNPGQIQTQGGLWTAVENSYPRYTNACLGAGMLQSEPGMGYIANVGGAQHLAGDMHYAQAVELAGPSPGPSADKPAEPARARLAARRKRATNPQSEENFQRALEAVRFGGIGFCKAARLFGVNNRTLWLEYKKKGYPNNRPSIRSRIKKEHRQPSPKFKQEESQHHMLVCPQQQVPAASYVESGPHGFPLQGVPQNTINLLGTSVTFSNIQ